VTRWWLSLLALTTSIAMAADLGPARAIVHQVAAPQRQDDSVGLPVPPPTLVPCGAALLVSNSPETFATNGVLFHGTATGAFRLFFHHSNGAATSMELVVRFTNLSPDDALTLRLARTRQGTLPTSVGRDAASVGQRAMALALSAQGQAGDDVRVPAGQSHELSIPMAVGDITSGCLDGRVDGGPVAIDLVARDDATRPLPTNVLPRSRIVPGVSPTIRGTFAHADRRADVRFVGGKAQRLDLGSARQGPYAVAIPGEYEAGQDESDKSVVWNVGNYGVLYDLNVQSDTAGQLVWNAAGGPSRFVVGRTDAVWCLDTGLPAHGGWGLGPLTPAAPMWLQLTVPGGSFAAGRLLYLPGG
jgi:hypothetical protein